MFLISNVVTGLVFLALLSGCTILSPEHELRVTEYDGRGWYMTANGAAAGCRVVRSGDVIGCLRFTGKQCTFTSAGCTPATEH
jgi:hypothetical protein